MRYIASLLLLLLLCGCGIRHCSPTNDVCLLNDASLDKAMDKRAANLRPYNVLVLSGGGSYGAWGSGVLCGWRQNPNFPKPENFDVVTAISTGALQATHAFLGTDVDDAALTKAYTKTRTQDVYSQRFLPFILFSDSIFDTHPLHKMLKVYFPNETIDRVADEAAKGRKLYIGSTNLDSGKLDVFDMTCLASQKDDPNRYDKYRQILLGATAIPGFFPPVEINGQLHADGGARAELFLDEALLPVVEKSHRKHATTSPTTNPGDSRVFVIINGQPGVGEQCTRDYIIDVAIRSVENLLDANEQASVDHIETLSHDRRNPFEMYVSYIPTSVPIDFGVADFDPAKMAALFQAGFNWAQSETWPQEGYMSKRRKAAATQP